MLVWLQVVVNAIIALLKAGRFEHWNKAHSSSSSSNKPSGSCVAMDYIVELLAAGRVTVTPSFALQLLEHLVRQAASASAGVVDADSNSHHSIQQSTLHRLNELEQQFISIVNVVGISAATAGAHANSSVPSAAQQQQQLNAVALTVSQAQAALRLASQAGFIRAAASIHHLQGSYEKAMAAYLSLSVQQQHQPAGATVFGYIDRFLSSSSNSGNSKQFMGAMLQHIEQLIKLDAAAIAALLLQHQPDYQVPVLVSLQQRPELQFRLLQATMHEAMLLQRAQQAHVAAEDDAYAADAADGTSSVTDTAAAADAAEKLLDRSEVADLYVQLLAKFDLGAVMPFLQCHHNYNVAAAIKACAAAGEGAEMK